jgi:hypothetical protein
MLGSAGNNSAVALGGRPQSALQRRIDGLGATGGHHHLDRFGINDVGDALSGILETSPDRLARMMNRRGVPHQVKALEV